MLTGIAAIFGRNHGVFFVGSALFAAVYLSIDRGFKDAPRLAGSYFSGIFVGYFPIVYFFVFDQKFRTEFINSLLSVFNWQLSLPVPFFWRMDYSTGFNFDTFHYFAVGLVCVLVPAIYLFGFVYLFKSVVSRAPKSQALLLLGASSLAGIPYLHQAFDRADFGHIAQSTLPVFIGCAAITSEFSRYLRQRLVSYSFCLVSLLVILGAWFTSLPASRSLRMESLYPGSIVSHRIGNNEFLINSYQSNVLKEVRRVTQKCNVSDNEFLALPHFPGVYAYLGLKAPF